MIENFAQAHKCDIGGTACIRGMRFEYKPKVGDSKAYLGAMQMEHGGSKKSWADIVEDDGKLQSDGTMLELDDDLSRRVLFASKAGTTEEGSQIGNESIHLMLETHLDLVESWGDLVQEQGEASDVRTRTEAIISSRQKYKRGKKKGDQYLVTWEG
ncbi:hypothetical protein A4A49_65157, partial [Nicotiana attenuata]